MTLREHVQTELRTAKECKRGGDVAGAWGALERAHVLSQPLALQHTRVHGHMLRLGLVTGDLREVLGQCVRILLAGPGSLTGRFPVGNTGRARIGLNTPMAIPDELARNLDGRDP